ncbi:hypothetical protein D3C87_1289890 [compost metagenome]|jgi:hypothetical protein
MNRKTFRLLSVLALAGTALPVSAVGFDWSTGQGLIDTCKVIRIPQQKATEDDIALTLMCVVQFKTWRESWTYADAYNTLTTHKSGPFCIPHLITHKALVEKFLDWSKGNMTRELKTQPSTLSVFTFMLATYPCPTEPKTEKQRFYEHES